MTTGTTRMEKDSLGTIAVDNTKYWGAQTQRSLENFPIGTEKMPQALIYAIVRLKQAAAIVNERAGKLTRSQALAINQACTEILAGKFDDNFPLSVWQTGSGTQTNMNVNEVIANRATEILSGSFRDKPATDPALTVHPNDQVNASQSSNDVFPSAIHVMAVLALKRQLIPALDSLKFALQEKAETFSDLIKIGRTHLQDATPITLGQEFSGYASMLEHAEKQLLSARDFCRELPIGGTAVGTGINTPANYGEDVCLTLSELTNETFSSAANKFHGLTSKDAVVFLSGALKALAANLMKIANDIRWMASGPRSGLGEINLPANEPGSSIMPGKINPTQCEALSMVCIQVMGNDANIGFAASQGSFELNAYMPVIAYDLAQSLKLLTDAMNSFNERCVKGITANEGKLKDYMERSLMLVTALSPVVGYEKAAQIAKKAYAENISLKEAAKRLGAVDEAEFDRIVDAKKMI